MPELEHCSYLLRLWREHDQQPWRVILIAVAQPNLHQHFTNVEECFAFLQAQAAPGAAGTGDQATGCCGAQMEAAGPETKKDKGIVAWNSPSGRGSGNNLDTLIGKERHKQ